MQSWRSRWSCRINTGQKMKTPFGFNYTVKFVMNFIILDIYCTIPKFCIFYTFLNLTHIPPRFPSWCICLLPSAGETKRQKPHLCNSESPPIRCVLTPPLDYMTHTHTIRVHAIGGLQLQLQHRL